MPRKNNRVRQALLADAAALGLRFRPDQAIIMSIRASQRLRNEKQGRVNKETNARSSSKESLT